MHRSARRTVQAQDFGENQDEDLIYFDKQLRLRQWQPNTPFRRTTWVVVQCPEHRHHLRYQLQSQQQDQKALQKDPRRAGRIRYTEAYEERLEFDINTR